VAPHAAAGRVDMWKRVWSMTEPNVGPDAGAIATLKMLVSQAAMAVVNEIATIGKADRVSLGLTRDSKLNLCTISRTAWFDPKSQLVEAIEIPNHPFFVGTQFHPEYKSHPLHPHPIFLGFIRACVTKKKLKA
jgi:hypothetical protein